MATGELKSISVDTELIVFAATVAVPLLFALVVPCCSKERLLRRRTSLNCDTMFAKSSLASFWSKAYILITLIQRLAFAAIIFGVRDSALQICTMVLVNFLICQLIWKIDQLYLDKHLKCFELFNQALLSLAPVANFLFSDFMPERYMLFDYGYYYSFGIWVYMMLGLAICGLYALAPLATWVRLYRLRKEQYRIAIEFRARLIREAKERKEARKQKKLASFNNFAIDLGHGE